jgi:RimJ/RimL family protein N-acetyltransferase
MRDPEMQTDRLDLVPFSRDDVDEFLRVWGDPEVIWWGHVVDREAAAEGLRRMVERIEAMPSGMGWWWAVVRDTGVVAGDVNLQPSPPEFDEEPEIGWHFAVDSQGYGYATEGAAAVVDRAREIGLDLVIATIVPMNTPSVRVAERLAMTRRPGTIERGGLAHGVWEKRLDDEERMANGE